MYNRTAQPGEIWDRYGSEYGNYFAPEGTPYYKRSMRPGSETLPINKYEVLESFNIVDGITAPWFSQPGGGNQIFSPFFNAKELVELGKIRKVL